MPQEVGIGFAENILSTATDKQLGSNYAPFHMIAMQTAEKSRRPSPISRKQSIVTRTTVNFCLDAVLLAAFLVLVILAVILRFVFPPAVQAEGWSLWEYGYDAWLTAWFNSVMIFALLVLVHVMLHWTWVCGVAARLLSKSLGRVVRIDDAAQTVYGVVLLMFLLSTIGVIVAIATLSIRARLA